jgi:DNA-binding CsgD family transcriptional regulator
MRTESTWRAAGERGVGDPRPPARGALPRVGGAPVGGDAAPIDPWAAVAQLFDAISYGLALVDADGTLCTANGAALQVLAQLGWLQGGGPRCLQPPHPADAERLQLALASARGGRSTLLYFGAAARDDDGPAQQGLSTFRQRARRLQARAAAAAEGAAEFGVAVVPLQPASAAASQPVRCGNGPLPHGAGPVGALVFARAAVSHPAAVAFFAREYGLTQAEESVLRELCHGLRPQDIARRLNIAVSTVRSHLRSLCQKTSSHGRVELLRHLALLPPLSMFDLHGGSAAPHARPATAEA